jgi:hypothetical protein
LSYNSFFNFIVLPSAIKNSPSAGLPSTITFASTDAASVVSKSAKTSSAPVASCSFNSAFFTR